MRGRGGSGGGSTGGVGGAERGDAGGLGLGLGGEVSVGGIAGGESGLPALLYRRAAPEGARRAADDAPVLEVMRGPLLPGGEAGEGLIKGDGPAALSPEAEVRV